MNSRASAKTAAPTPSAQAPCATSNASTPQETSTATGSRTVSRLGSLARDPRAQDSDGDGIFDDVEVGANTDAPLDSDGDGRWDINESSTKDADQDCLADQVDPVDDTYDGLIERTCATAGVCTKPMLGLACSGTTLSCDYAGVAAYKPLDTCNGLDDNCDGTTDEDATCDDGNPCTDDSCGATGCLTQPNNELCEDGDLCTVGDTCVAGVCGGGNALDCADDNPCTDDTCDPALGCRNDPNSSPCDDEDACTTDDLCAAGICGSGSALDCDDGTACTVDSCDVALGCANLPDAGLCDDGDPCSTDTCVLGSGCQNVVDVACDLDSDGVPNSVDSDDEDPNVCADSDSDGCDDCSNTGADLSGGDVADDGGDVDGDGVCDVTDTDIDGDDLPNEVDDCPAGASAGTDTDGDGCKDDGEDDDDDDDGVPDVDEQETGTNPLDPSSKPAIVYVSAVASGAADGTSWADALGTLRDGLKSSAALGATVTTPTLVWVSAGTFYPDEGNGATNNNRNSSFRLSDNVHIYGGFAGTESSIAERDLTANESVLSGDIDQNDSANPFADNSSAGNCCHVVRGGGTTSAALLDGFTITAGRAKPNCALSGGGGVLNWAVGTPTASPRLRRLLIVKNQAVLGGGMTNGATDGTTSTPTLVDVTFLNNKANDVGGGLYNRASAATVAPTLVNVAFLGNSVAAFGDAMADLAINSGVVTSSLTNVVFAQNGAVNGFVGGAYDAHTTTGGSVSPTFTNCTIASNNEASGIFIRHAGGNVSITMNNSIVWSNSSGDEVKVWSGTPTFDYLASLVKGSDLATSYPGADNLDGTDASNAPQFVDPAQGDFRLKASSPLIDAGNSALIPEGLTTDLDGQARVSGASVDIGAYESQ